MRNTLLALSLVALVAGITPAAAQTAPASTFDQLSDRVIVGQKLEIHTDKGQRIRGRLVERLPESLSLEVDGASGRETLTFTPDQLNRVVKRDGLMNGMLIGLGSGVAAALVFVRAVCGPTGEDRECETYTGLAGTGFVAGGLGAGLLIDHLINKTIFTRPGGSSVGFAPIVGRRQRGASVVVRF